MNDEDYTVEFITTGNLGTAMVVRYQGAVISSVREWDSNLNLGKLARKARRVIRQHQKAARTLSDYTVDWGKP